MDTEKLIKMGEEFITLHEHIRQIKHYAAFRVTEVHEEEIYKHCVDALVILHNIKEEIIK